MLQEDSAEGCDMVLPTANKYNLKHTIQSKLPNTVILLAKIISDIFLQTNKNAASIKTPIRYKL